MSFLSVLLPRWNFFDQVAPKATLYYKLTSANHWVACLKPPSRKFLHLFINPYGNLYLAQHGIIENLIHDIHEQGEKAVDKIEETVSYKLIINLIRMHLRSKKVRTAQFQFKIIVQAPEETYDLIVSKEHSL
jgi:hypothetical protein